MRLLGGTEFDFLGKRYIALALSAVVIGSGLVAFMTRGPVLGIDFAGGSQIVAKFAAPPDLTTLRNALAGSGLAEATIQEFEQGSNEILVRTPRVEEGEPLDIAVAAITEAFRSLSDSSQSQLDLNMVGRDQLLDSLVEHNPLQFDLEGDLESAQVAYQAQVQRVLDAKRTVGLFTEWDDLAGAGLDAAVLESLRARAHFGGFTIRDSQSVSPQVGDDLRRRTIQAVVWALIGMLAYITYRFEFKFGIAAVVALIHDVLVVLGAFVIAGREFNLPVVAAFLTIVGYSLNDTVVVFDRVRENTNVLRRTTLYERINISLNQTLSRTMLTSTTTLIVVVAVFVYGGPVINDFSFALLVGVVVGTYSSLFVASPVVYEWQARELARRRR
ncbi:MAG TPA: protein translocase subunit SecF [Acidobacteriota bacterium]|nr:protein translocase subunit SecF [Acidobacteriota bacterium]